MASSLDRRRRRRPAPTKTLEPSDGSQSLDEPDDAEEKKFQPAIAGVCIPVPMSEAIEFKDISGLQREKDRIRRAFVYPIMAPRLFTGQAKSMLLYGPPGTGKSLIARALLKEIPNSIMVAPVGSDLRSEYFGGSANLVKQAFECTSKIAYARDREERKAAGTNMGILFIDEFESIGSKRQAKDVEQSSMLTTLLQLMQGVQEIYPNVVVVGATNKPWDLDSAILRRFRASVFIDVPKADARRDIIVKQLRRMYTPVSVSRFKDIDTYEGVKDSIWKLTMPQIDTNDIEKYQVKINIETNPVVDKNVVDYFMRRVLKLRDEDPKVRQELMQRKVAVDALVELLVTWSGGQPANIVFPTIQKELGLSAKLTKELSGAYTAYRKEDVHEKAISMFGYSASDLDNVLKEAIDSAALDAVQRGFRQCDSPFELDCFAAYGSCPIDKKAPCVQLATMKSQDKQILQNFTINVDHFQQAFQGSKSTILPEEYIEYIYYDLTGRRLPSVVLE